MVARLIEMLKEADSRGSKFVVFPELALTTFFPRWWMEDQAEVDRRYFEQRMPSPETQPTLPAALPDTGGERSSALVMRAVVGVLLLTAGVMARVLMRRRTMGG